jgi:hypothetical protein
VARHHPKLPVLVMSAIGSADMEFQVREFYGFRYLEKPIEPARLVEEVRRVLGDRRGSRIKGITLAGLLQVLHLERKSCTVTITSSGLRGEFRLDGGELTNAVHGGLQGEEVAHAMLAWEDPEIEIHYDAPSVARTIVRPLSQVLIEAMRLKDERTRQRAQDMAARMGTPLLPGQAARALAEDDFSDLDEETELRLRPTFFAASAGQPAAPRSHGEAPGAEAAPLAPETQQLIRELAAEILFWQMRFFEQSCGLERRDMSFLLWEVGTPDEEPQLFGHLVDLERRRLRELADLIGGWWHWREDHAVVFVEQADWEALYAEWKREGAGATSPEPAA